MFEYFVLPYKSNLFFWG